MNQVADILTLAKQAELQNVDAVLATVVRTEGSAYRRAGAMMLICADGRSVGMISGGCLEPHIIKRAFWLTRNGASVQVYQTGDEQRELDDENSDELEFEADDELNFGLGCNGKVHVLFERLKTAKPLLNLIHQARTDGQPVTVATLIKAENLGLLGTPLSIGTRINLDAYKAAGQITSVNLEQKVLNFTTLENTVITLAKHKFCRGDANYVIVENKLEQSNDHNSKEQAVQTEWLIQRIEPQKRLLICGAGNDVMPLVTMAKLQDWHVTVIDSRSQYATSTRFPQADVVKCLSLDDSDILIKLSQNAAVALMSHSLSQDRARLSTLLANSNFSYLGQLGPRYRTERLIAEINVTMDNSISLAKGIEKLHYPIGLKLGGDGPEALALSIMAQISAVFHGQASQTTSSDNKHNLQPSRPLLFEHDYTDNYVSN